MKVIGHRLCYDDNRQIEQLPSPNHGGELDKPRLLVMHYTAGRSARDSASWLRDPRAKASAHVVIGADGVALQLVGFDRIAWHAGVSEWTIDDRRVQSINRVSIGIELDNPGRLVRQGDRYRSLSLGTVYDAGDVVEARHKNEVYVSAWHVYPTAQLESALDVARTLIEAYGLTDVVGHDDIAPKRKSDPGPAFPMDHFRTRLFGRAEGGEA